MICLGSNISLNLRCLTSSFVPWALGPLVLWKSDEKQFDKNMQDWQRQSKCETNTKKMLDDDFDGQAGATLPPTVQSRA